jgi:hypothetical protein
VLRSTAASWRVDGFGLPSINNKRAAGSRRKRLTAAALVAFAFAGVALRDERGPSCAWPYGLIAVFARSISSFGIA